MSKPTCEKCGSEKDLIGEAPTYCGACLREEINRVRDTPVEIGEAIPLFKDRDH